MYFIFLQSKMLDFVVTFRKNCDALCEALYALFARRKCKNCKLGHKLQHQVHINCMLIFFFFFKEETKVQILTIVKGCNWLKNKKLKKFLFYSLETITKMSLLCDDTKIPFTKKQSQRNQSINESKLIFWLNSESKD